MTFQQPLRTLALLKGCWPGTWSARRSQRASIGAHRRSVGRNDPDLDALSRSRTKSKWDRSSLQPVDVPVNELFDGLKGRIDLPVRRRLSLALRVILFCEFEAMVVCFEQMMIRNLLYRNALEYTPSGKVLVRMSPSSRRFAVEILGSGIRHCEMELQAIFEESVGSTTKVAAEPRPRPSDCRWSKT